MVHLHTSLRFGIPMLSLVLLLIGDAYLTAAENTEPLVSGMPENELVRSFKIEDVTGPFKGENLCYPCKYGSKPVIALFFRETSEELATLLKEVDSLIQKFENKKLRAFGILITAEPEKDKQTLIELAEKQQLKNLPLTTFYGIDGPSYYRISQEAEINQMYWMKSRVKTNHAFRSAKELTQKQRQLILREIEILLQ